MMIFVKRSRNPVRIPMQNIIDTLLSNPAYLIIGAVLAVILLVGLVRKIFKLVIFLLILFVAFIGYLYFTGQSIPTSTEEMEEAVSETVNSAIEAKKE